jgi:hypothetical protein
MQREILDGVPFWSDKDNKLYYYDTTPAATKVCIGNKSADGLLQLLPNYEQILAPLLASYRSTIAGRSRKPSEAKKK